MTVWERTREREREVEREKVVEREWKREREKKSEREIGRYREKAAKKVRLQLLSPSLSPERKSVWNGILKSGREREIEREKRERERYIYMYIYIYIEREWKKIVGCIQSAPNIYLYLYVFLDLPAWPWAWLRKTQRRPPGPFRCRWDPLRVAGPTFRWDQHLDIESHGTLFICCNWQCVRRTSVMLALPHIQTKRYVCLTQTTATQKKKKRRRIGRVPITPAAAAAAAAATAAAGVS
jgi:hypothetical protein